MPAVRVVLEARTATRCPTCNYLNPLAGLRHVTECVSCAAPIDIAARVRANRTGGLTYTFGGYYDAVAEALLYEGDHELEDGSSGEASSINLRKVRSVVCACGAPLDTPAVGAADLRCGGCGSTTAVRWPDQRTREWDPRITYLVGDADDRGVVLRQKLDGTIVGCGQCGAPLARHGRQRAVVCSHCNAENFLSDAIWTKLFPRPEQHTFYLVYDLDEDAYASAFAYLLSENHYYFDAAEAAVVREKASPIQDRVLAARVKLALANEAKIEAEVARAIVSRTDLDAATIARVDKRLAQDVREHVADDKTSPAFIAHWLASRDDDVRALGARGARGDALRACAVDKSRNVRAVVAARKDTPADLLAVLRKDPDDTVRQAARTNASYQPGFLSKLFGA